MAASKISPGLQEKLKTTPPDEQLEVIVQLQPPQISKSGSTQERIREVQRAFDLAIEELSRRMSPSKGSILQTAWINSTARCLATPDQIRVLEPDPSVVSVDLPATLQFQ
jgi:hypothetical protein